MTLYPNQHSIQEETVPDALIADNPSIAERFEIVRMRGKGFENHEEDSSAVDSPSDCPAVMELFRFFRDCE